MILNQAENIMLGNEEVQAVKCDSAFVWKRSAPSPSGQQISGVPPLAFRSTGANLLNYVISGASGGVGDYLYDEKYRITVAMLNKNLYGYQITAEQDGYLDDNGVVWTQTLNNYITSGFIPIPSGISQLTYSFLASRYTDSRVVVVCAYDSNQNFISAPIYEADKLMGDFKYSYPFTVPDGTAFIRASYITNKYNSSMKSSDYQMQLEVSTEATDYEISRARKFYIDVDAPLNSGDTYTYDGTVAIGTTSGWNFLFVETAVQPENVTIQYEVEE